jgi:hypothetical protein
MDAWGLRDKSATFRRLIPGRFDIVFLKGSNKLCSFELFSFNYINALLTINKRFLVAVASL